MSEQKNINRQPANNKDGVTNSFTRREMVIGGTALAAGLTTVGLANPDEVKAQRSQQNDSTERSVTGKLEGKVAVITGAARGLGRACAVALAREGADIVSLDIAKQIPGITGYRLSMPNDLMETERLVKAQGRRCISIQADVRDMGQMRQTTERTIKELGKIDILVANAGIAAWSRFAEMTDEQWNLVIDVNLTGVANSMRAVIPHMIERRQGRIIAMSSIGGRTGVAGVANYAATKWGIIGLVKSVALELGKDNITVNAVCPTAVNTPLYRSEGQRRSTLSNLDHPTDKDQDAQSLQYHALPPGACCGAGGHCLRSCLPCF